MENWVKRKDQQVLQHAKNLRKNLESSEPCVYDLDKTFTISSIKTELFSNSSTKIDFFSLN